MGGLAKDKEADSRPDKNFDKEKDSQVGPLSSRSSIKEKGDLLLALQQTERKALQPKIDELQKEMRSKKRLVYTGLFILGIVILNIILIYPLFTGEYSQFLPVKSGYFISQAKFIADNIGHFSWNNLQQGGFPSYLFDSPVLIFLLVIGKKIIAAVSVAHFYRIIVAIFYILSAVFFYLFVRYLTRKEFTALVAALLYSAPPFFTALLLPGTIITKFKDLGIAPWRIIDLISEGSGQHIIALALLPLALLLFIKALRFPSLKNYIYSSLLATAVIISDWKSLFSLVLFFIIILFSEVVVGNASRKLKNFLWIVLITAGLVSFWVNMPFIRNMTEVSGAGLSIKNILGVVPLGFVLLPIIGTGLYLLFDHKPRWQPFLMSSLLVVLFFIVSLSSLQLGKDLLMDPVRYLPEFNLSVCLLLALIFTWLVEKIRRWARMKLPLRESNFISGAVIVVFLGFFIFLATFSYGDTHQLTKPKTDVGSSAEYRIAQELASFTGGDKNIRVFASGSTAAWLNVFNQTTQATGNSYGAINQTMNIGQQEIETGTNPELAEKWLKAMRVSYVAVNTSTSQTETNNYENFDKFSHLSFLTPVWQEKGDIIYQSTGDYKIEAQAVLLSEIQKVGEIQSSDDGNLDKYLEVINNARQPLSTFWQSNNQIQITGDLLNGEAVQIPINYEAGWRAYQNGKKIAVEKDPAGFIYLKPQVSNKDTVEITLSYESNWLVVLGYFITLLTVLILIALSTKRVRNYLERRRTAYEPSGVLIAPKAERFVDMIVEPPEVEKEKMHERAKKYYQEKEDFDWVETTDNFQGLDTFFHRNREELTKRLVEHFGVGNKYLDAGCGTGLVLRNLPAGSIGLDINPRAIAKAKENAPHAALVIADMEEIPFPDNMFTTVVCTEVLDRLPDPKKAIKEILRVLQPGGVLIGTLPRENPMWRLRFLSSYNPAVELWRKEYKRNEAENLFSSFEIVQLSPALSYMTWAFVVEKPK